MLTSKQRAFLRSEASKADALFQIGKGGLGETVIQSAGMALDARELIKLSVLDNSDEDPREAAEEIARATGAEVVAVIGRKIILFRESSRKEKRKISEQVKGI
ncbi:MAG: ribosome assembly RNA-binding protein YhbY [Clostridia bacterium]|nr:ribosome assembly RNA-binding protein YhbY [Clostridia bacterium]